MYGESIVQELSLVKHTCACLSSKSGGALKVNGFV